ncbi:hypothetical protein [Synechococcus phage BUCT-ZZ01]|nr:hypothetical protein [Synechococcus phage BUCT-ZZ01]
MLVYRLEKNREGIYSSGLIIRLEMYKFYYDDFIYCPEPRHDKKLSWAYAEYFDSMKHFFGFESIEQLQKWFRIEDHRKIFSFEGVKLVVYEVDLQYVYRGNTQIFFEMDKASKIENLEIDWINTFVKEKEYA